MLPPLWLGLVLATLAVATIADLRHRQIPDACPLVLLAIAVLAASFGALSWPAIAAGFVLGAGLGVSGFALGAWGGGDAKLVAALGACLGFPAILPALLYTALGGGVLAALAALRGRREIAYAPAIGAGVLLAEVLS